MKRRPRTIRRAAVRKPSCHAIVSFAAKLLAGSVPPPRAIPPCAASVRPYFVGSAQLAGRPQRR